jgi:anti-sigma regulatory factor (Ser/Thr protein kinase)
MNRGCARMQGDWSYTSSWSADRGAVAQARGFVRECLSWHPDGHAVDDVVVVASELVTNAVVHARTPFSVTLASHRGRVSLTVRDASSALPAGADADPSASGGRGLQVVQALSTAWGVGPDTDGGKSVWAAFEGDAQQRSVRTAWAGAGEVGYVPASPTSPPVTA